MRGLGVHRRGLLEHAVRISGFFIRQGEVVGIEDARGRRQILADRDEEKLANNAQRLEKNRKQVVEDMREIMVENGDAEKQVAILEMGWTLDEVNPEYAWFAVDEATQRYEDEQSQIVLS